MKGLLYFLKSNYLIFTIVCFMLFILDLIRKYTQIAGTDQKWMWIDEISMIHNFS